MTLAFDGVRGRARLTEADRQRIIAARQAGRSWAELEALAGVGHDTVYRVLKAAGLTRRHRAPGTVPVRPRCPHCGHLIRSPR